jgi:hypothetical protein
VVCVKGAAIGQFGEAVGDGEVLDAAVGGGEGALIALHLFQGGADDVDPDDENFERSWRLRLGGEGFTGLRRR